MYLLHCLQAIIFTKNRNKNDVSEKMMIAGELAWQIKKPAKVKAAK